MSDIGDAIDQLSRSIAEHGATPEHVFLPYIDLCELRGVPVDPWVTDRRALVHIHGGEWHWFSACTSECPR